jgi:hypothetical protein
MCLRRIQPAEIARWFDIPPEAIVAFTAVYEVTERDSGEQTMSDSEQDFLPRYVAALKQYDELLWQLKAEPMGIFGIMPASSECRLVILESLEHAVKVLQRLVKDMAEVEPAEEAKRLWLSMFPLPWRIEQDGDSHEYYLIAANGNRIASGFGFRLEEKRHVFEHIIRCVNEHETKGQGIDAQA